MAIDFPNVKFDWLGELPAIAEDARLRRARSSLGDLKLHTSSDLDAAASRLAELGDFEGSLKLSTLATQRKSAEAAMLSAQQRGADIELWRQMIGAGKLPQYGGGAAPPPEPSIGVVPGAPPVPPPGLPGMPGVGSVGPGASLPPSPSEALLARAEEPPPTAPAPTQLVGPPPTPDTSAGPPPMAPTAPVPFAPQAPEGTAPPPPVPGLPMPMRSPEQEAARSTELRIGNATVQLPPRATNWPAYRANVMALQNALSQQKASPAQVDYALDQAQRSWSGLPVQTRGEWEFDKTNAGKRYEEVQRTYKYYQEKGQGADSVIQKGELMQRILDDPRYVPGESRAMLQPWVDSATRGVVSALRTAQAYGIPLPVSEDQLRTITDPVALRELVKSLHNQLVIAGLGGSLGNRISDADAIRMATTVSSLQNSPGGAELINKIGIELAKRAKLEQGFAAQYRRENEYRGNGPGMDTYVQQRMKDYADKNPILVTGEGKLTPLGRNVQDTIGGGQGGGGPLPSRRIVGPGGQVFNSEEEAWKAYRESQQ